MSIQLERTLLALAGEFLSAARLCLRGYTANLTLKNFPGIDIFAYNTRSGKTIAIQVKTALEKHDKSFTATHPFIVANASYEELDSELERQVKSSYVFVYVLSDKSDAEFYIAPPGDVRRLAKNDFMRWWNGSRHKKPLEELKTTRQPITIALDDLKAYKDKWNLLDEA